MKRVKVEFGDGSPAIYVSGKDPMIEIEEGHLFITVDGETKFIAPPEIWWFVIMEDEPISETIGSGNEVK